MTDNLDKATRARNMSRVRGKDTGPEITVRRALYSAGFRFRLHRRDLPGTPDIVLSRYRTAIFVNGCFWHGHDCKRGKLPHTRADFWSTKISGNVERDKQNHARLEQAGWQVIVLWECRLRSPEDWLPSTLKALIPLKATYDTGNEIHASAIGGTI